MVSPELDMKGLAHNQSVQTFSKSGASDFEGGIRKASQIFPDFKCSTRASIPADIPFHSVLQYAYLPVKAFSPEIWPNIWNGDEIRIDHCLFRGKSGQKVFHESDFLNISYRLVIDSEKAHDLPKLGRGTIISFGNSNTPNYRYIIDSCVSSDERLAFLRVTSFTPDQHIGDVHSRRPPFILQIPVSFCFTRRSYSIEHYKCAIELEDICRTRHSTYLELEESTDQGLWSGLLKIMKCKWITSESFRITTSDRLHSISLIVLFHLVERGVLFQVFIPSRSFMVGTRLWDPCIIFAIVVLS
jgi:hypothetical protein